jgi:hypothetical protein
MKKILKSRVAIAIGFFVLGAIVNDWLQMNLLYFVITGQWFWP